MNRIALVAFAVVFTSACHRRVEAKSAVAPKRPSFNVSCDAIAPATATSGLPSHHLAFAKRFVGAGTQVTKGVHTDAEGNVFVSGLNKGTVDFGGGPRQAKVESLYAAKFDSSGRWLWDAEFPVMKGMTDTFTGSLGPKLAVVDGIAHYEARFGDATTSEQGPVTAGNFFELALDAKTGGIAWQRRFERAALHNAFELPNGHLRAVVNSATDDVPECAALARQFKWNDTALVEFGGDGSCLSVASLEWQGEEPTFTAHAYPGPAGSVFVMGMHGAVSNKPQAVSRVRVQSRDASHALRFDEDLFFSGETFMGDVVGTEAGGVRLLINLAHEGGKGVGVVPDRTMLVTLDAAGVPVKTACFASNPLAWAEQPDGSVLSLDMSGYRFEVLTWVEGRVVAKTVLPESFNYLLATTAPDHSIWAWGLTTESAAVQVGDASLPRGAGWDAVLLHFVR